MSVPDALDVVENLFNSPGTRPLIPGSRHLEILRGLCQDLSLSGDAIPDAYLAALAVENEATLCSADAGFRRFRGLKFLNLVEIPSS